MPSLHLLRSYHNPGQVEAIFTGEAELLGYIKTLLRAQSASLEATGTNQGTITVEGVKVFRYTIEPVNGGLLTFSTTTLRFE